MKYNTNLHILRRAVFFIDWSSFSLPHEENGNSFPYLHTGKPFLELFDFPLFLGNSSYP